MKTELHFQLHCTDFPGAQFDCWSRIYVGVQKNEDIEAETPGDATSAVFNIPVSCNVWKDGTPNFTGPYVFGPTGDKFLYLVWYAKTPDFIHRFRRAKIKLNTLSWEQIRHAREQQKPLIAQIRLTDKKGGPVCASLKEPNIKW